MRGILGILKGNSITISRYHAYPIVEYDELSRWASEQANLAKNLTTDQKKLIKITEFIIALCGDPQSLPIALSFKGYLNFQEIVNFVKPLNEILILQDASHWLKKRKFNYFSLKNNVLSISMGFPGILQFHRNMYTSDLPDSFLWPLKCLRKKLKLNDIHFLIKITEYYIIKAVSEAWSISMDDIISFSKFSSDQENLKREIGLGDGKSVFSSVDIIKKPN